MPSVSQAQQKLMGADLARAEKGEATKTGMGASQLKDFASTKRKGLPMRKTSTRKAGIGR